jgi:hypothetical protein
MGGERFNELKISRFTKPKPGRGFKTIYAGSRPSCKARATQFIFLADVKLTSAFHIRRPCQETRFP